MMKLNPFPIIRINFSILLVLFFLCCLHIITWSQEAVFDESGLLSEAEKEQVEAAMAGLGLGHINLADDFEGLRPNDFAYNTYKEVFYNRIPIGNEGFVIAYNILDSVFAIYNGAKWTHIIENNEKQYIINELLKPAFKNGQYAQGLLAALSKIDEILKGNKTFPMSDELLNKDLIFVDEPGLFAQSLTEEIEEYLKEEGVTTREHVIYIRSYKFDGKDFDPHYSPYHSEGASKLDDINYIYALQNYNALFEDRANKFQVGHQEPPDLTLIGIFGDEFYLLSNWENFLKVEPSVGEAHTRTLTDYLGWLYDDYVAVGREIAGLKRVVKIVIALSKKEIKPLRSEFKPPFFSLAWFNSPLRLAVAIFGAIVLILALTFLILRKRSS